MLGESHALTLASMSGLADLFEAESRWKEAETLRREVVTALTREEHASLSDLAVARMRLGRALLECERFNEAEAELVAAHRLAAAGLERSDAARECATVLVRLYEAWDHADPDTGHRAQRDVWKALENSASSGPGPAGE